MRNSARNLLTAAVMTLALGGLVACQSSGSSTTTTALSRQDTTQFRYTGEVYLLRGLANVFSTGLDDMNNQFRRQGVNSRVDNHSAWPRYAEDIIARHARGRISYPIVIMGHSLGGNASVQMAKYLGDRGIKVAYVVAFDPTVTTWVGPNVDKVVNYYLPNEKDGKETNIVKGEPGTSAEITNFDARVMSVDHFNIEKQPDLQRRLIANSVALMRKRQRMPRVGEP